MSTKACALARGEQDPCGRPARAEVRFEDAPEEWLPACPGCIKDRMGNQPFVVILETRRIRPEVKP